MPTATKLAPVHPGEILREEYMNPLGLSMNALAKALRVDAPRIKGIVDGERSITPDTALRLARYFDTTPDFWINLQAHYDIRTAHEHCWNAIESEVIPMAGRGASKARI